MKKYKFSYKDQFIKVMICYDKKDAFLECRNLEKDYNLGKYTVKCEAL